MEHKARRRHVPAFGEWNYYSSSSSPEEPQLPHSAAGDSAWWYAAAEPEACSDAWFRYSPPPRRPAAEQKLLTHCNNYIDSTGNGNWGMGVGVPAAKARARASHAVSAPAKGAARRVVKTVELGAAAGQLRRFPPSEMGTFQSAAETGMFQIGCGGGRTSAVSAAVARGG